MSTEASRRATAERAARHKAEVNRLIRTMWMYTGGSFAFGFAVAFGVIQLIDREPWRSDAPPVEQKVQVVTHGWYHKKKGWCSYDCGEPITVKEWRP